MEKIDYQKILDTTLKTVSGVSKKPRLLLHACCAPCSSYVIEYLERYFDITVYFYNPNIAPETEYDFRARELERLLREMPLSSEVKLVVEEYNSDEFYNISQGREEMPEGGERCKECYRLRLEKTARYAAENKFDFFCTTLSVSPYKNAARLNDIGAQLGEVYGVEYLISDFKKKNGYKRSCELSKEYGLYRQDYCGCEFSRAEALRRKANQ
ncbi:MAG: epoxyqueuosine reductase QueH [Ruminococcaceae bacterium]|nr:epoxyqueuosine reductase QueH [Oscillospiraceae bacterium]